MPTKWYLRVLLVITVVLVIALAGVIGWAYLLRSPSNERNWAQDQQVLPYAVFQGDKVEIKNIRNFTYRSTDDYTPYYYDKTFDLNKILSVDYVVEPLASVAAAHTFLTFGFSDGSRVAISVETRKEVGEDFSPFKGVLNEYELMYVIFDERDGLLLRAIHRDHPVFLYPIKAKPESIRKLFVRMLERTNELKDEPEFYNTITNSCATNIADHINDITPKTIPWDIRLLLPKNSDELAYELGFIDNSISLEEARQRYYINDLVKKYANDPKFSEKIREGG